MSKPRQAEPALPARIRRAIQESGRSLNQLGQLAGLDHARLSRFVRGERDLTLSAAGRLCEVLGLELTDRKGSEASTVPPTPVVLAPMTKARAGAKKPTGRASTAAAPSPRRPRPRGTPTE
jgi:transcriptional regulator with XRE-family HTH domain